MYLRKPDNLSFLSNEFQIDAVDEADEVVAHVPIKIPSLTLKVSWSNFPLFHARYVKS